VIVFDLACDRGHQFEGWFGSAGDFDRQCTTELIECPECGSTAVSRLPSAAYVNTGSAPAPAKEGNAAPAAGQYAGGAAAGLARLVEYITKNSEDVGARFPEEARKIHYREAPERQIRGTASGEQVQELTEEGIEVLPLPGNLFSKRH
jgi:hypothetical protein